MRWLKKGLIYCPNDNLNWINNSAMTPQPFLINENVIRVFAGFRDKEGRSRIGYVDVDASNPANVLSVSTKPVIDLGEDGTFDNNGLILGDVIRVQDKVYMYYVGFQMVQNVKHVNASGLAISNDNGEHFKRFSRAPILDRTDYALFGRCIHTVIYDERIFKVWYSSVHSWKIIDSKPYPAYDIWYSESEDGIRFWGKEIKCMSVSGDEYRIGRPKVIKRNDNSYEMRYTLDTINKEYKTGIAFSKNGTEWIRDDEKTGITISPLGWDSEMVCYPVELKTRYGTYLFYNGNGMGYTGFGYAKLEEE
jgi:predicted GH43/DUF377 family glycosyl hydrolase